MRRPARLAAASIAALALLAPGAAEAQDRRPPVVVVVFDEFPTTSLLGRGGAVDAVRYPNFAALARDGTWYRNATTVHDSTFASVPAILDGKRPRYDPHRGPVRQSLLSLLQRHGYRVQASDETAGLCPARFCGQHHPVRYYLDRNRLDRFDEFISGIQPGAQPTLYFKHTLLPHVPWLYLPDGRAYLHGVRGPIRGLNSQLGVRDRGLVHLAYQRHLLQVGAVDYEIGKLVARLKRTGLYDRSLVVLTADEGISFRLAQTDRRTLTRATVQDVAPVPLFIKRPYQGPGGVSRAYARTVDVLPTIADLLDIRVPWRTAGRSVFSAAVRARRTVRVAGRSPSAPVVRLRAGAFQSRWQRAIRYKLSVFGYGQRGPGLFGLGPHRWLIGQEVDRLGVAPPGRVRATISGAGDFGGVRLKGSFLPCLVAGRIVGGRPGDRRDLAIAVNGKVAAVGRTFSLGGRRAEYFAVLVPPEVFREGRNPLQVIRAVRRGQHLQFRLLGSA